MPGDIHVNPILDAVALRLHMSSSSLSAAIVPEYRFVTGQVSSAYPCIGSGQSLTGTDSSLYESALALLLSARVYSAYLTGQGVLLSVQTADGSKEQYAPIPNAAPADWLGEASALLARVSCVQRAFITQSAGVHLMGTSSRRQTIQKRFPVYGGGFGCASGLLDFGLYPYLGLTL